MLTFMALSLKMNDVHYHYHVPNHMSEAELRNLETTLSGPEHKSARCFFRCFFSRDLFKGFGKCKEACNAE